MRISDWSSDVCSSDRAPGADLIGADLRGQDLRNADLRGALLTAADLRGADVTAADLLGADLRDARVDSGALASALFLTARQRDAVAEPACNVLLDTDWLKFLGIPVHPYHGWIVQWVTCPHHIANQLPSWPGGVGGPIN